MAKGTLFIVSAPSGAGKSSLIDALLKRFNTDDSLRLSISHTTRSPRPGEVDHVNYHFVDVEEFRALIERDAFFEYAQVFDNFYGTSKEIVMDWINQGKDVLFDIDWQGARKIKEQVPDAVKIFILPPSLQELHRRLIRRGQDNEEVIQKRMSKALSEISHYDEYDYIIINDNFDLSLVQLRSVILSKHNELKMIKETNSDLFKQMESQAQEFNADPAAFNAKIMQSLSLNGNGSVPSAATTTSDANSANSANAAQPCACDNAVNADTATTAADACATQDSATNQAAVNTEASDLAQVSANN